MANMNDFDPDLYDPYADANIDKDDSQETESKTENVPEKNETENKDDVSEGNIPDEKKEETEKENNENPQKQTENNKNETQN